MTAKHGAFVLIKIGNGGSPETFLTVGGLRISDLKLNQSLLNATHVESGEWRKLLAAGKSLTIRGSGLFTDANSEEMVRAQAFGATACNYRFIFGNGSYIAGPFHIHTYERGGDHDGEELYSLTLESAGTIAYHAS